MMRVWLIDIGEPLPIDGKSVRLRRVGNLAYAAAKYDNIEVHWFAGSFDHVNKIQRVKKTTNIRLKKNLTLHICMTTGYKKNVSFKRILSYRKVASSLREKMNSLTKPDIIFGAIAPIETSKMIQSYCKKNDVPYIMDVRDLWPENFYDIVPKWTYPVVSIYVELCKNNLKKSLGDASAITALNENFLEYGLKYAKRNKTQYDRVFPLVYPEYSYSKSKGIKSEFWKKYNLQDDDFIILFLGFFGKQTDADTVLKAAEITNKVNGKIKYLLCGNGENLSRLKAKAPSNCIFTGLIGKDEIIDILPESKIGLLPIYDYEGFRMNTPNKFGEYLSAGLVVLESVSGRMEKLLTQYYCGARYHNSRDLAKKILMYSSNTELYNQQSINSKELYNLMFNGTKENAKMTKYIVRVAGRFKKFI